VRLILSTIVVTILPLQGAHAQNSSPQSNSENAKCFEISRTNVLVDPSNPILINKCTGDTWMLVKSEIVDVNGHSTDSFTYRWFKLGESSDTASLSYPKRSFTPPSTPRGAGPFQ